MANRCVVFSARPGASKERAGDRPAVPAPLHGEDDAAFLRAEGGGHRDIRAESLKTAQMEH